MEPGEGIIGIGWSEHCTREHGGHCPPCSRSSFLVDRTGKMRFVPPKTFPFWFPSSRLGTHCQQSSCFAREPSIYGAMCPKQELGGNLRSQAGAWERGRSNQKSPHHRPGGDIRPWRRRVLDAPHASIHGLMVTAARCIGSGRARLILSVLSRHGEVGYEIFAPFINARANLYALKALGVSKVLAWVLGSLRGKSWPPGTWRADDVRTKASGLKSSHSGRPASSSCTAPCSARSSGRDAGGAVDVPFVVHGRAVYVATTPAHASKLWRKSASSASWATWWANNLGAEVSAGTGDCYRRPEPLRRR